MPVSEAAKRAKAKYRTKSVKQINVSFYPKDLELYEFICSQENKAGYIRDLIRADQLNHA